MGLATAERYVTSPILQPFFSCLSAVRVLFAMAFMWRENTKTGDFLKNVRDWQKIDFIFWLHT